MIKNKKISTMMNIKKYFEEYKTLENFELAIKEENKYRITESDLLQKSREGFVYVCVKSNYDLENLKLFMIEGGKLVEFSNCDYIFESDNDKTQTYTTFIRSSYCFRFIELIVKCDNMNDILSIFLKTP